MSVMSKEHHGKQLFLDDAMLENVSCVQRTLHQPQKHPANPLVRPHAPWISEALIHGSVLLDEGLWRMWYMAKTDFGLDTSVDRYISHAVCYAESEDGITWRYPDLDVFSHEGQPTNVVLHRELFPGQSGFYGVVRCPEGAEGPDRYVAMVELLWHSAEQSPLRHAPVEKFRRPDWYRRAVEHGGCVIASSPDGIHWTFPEPFPAPYTLDYPADKSHFMYDEQRSRYVTYGRHLTPPSVRSIQWMESTDLIEWTPCDPLEVLAVDKRDPDGTEIYSMPVMNYGAQYIGFLQMYDKPAGVLEIQLAASRDGVNWTRVADRATWIPAGGAGQWDRFNQSPANSAPVRVGDELWFYYSGRTYRHAGHSDLSEDRGPNFAGIGLATLRLDGFVSMDATFEPGRILTKVTELGGGELHLNVHSPFGEVRLEILATDGIGPGNMALDSAAVKVLAASDPLTVDSVDAAVTWDSTPALPGAALGRPVHLRFTLINANLYAWWPET